MTRLAGVDARGLMLDTYRHTLGELDPERLVRERLEPDPETSTRIVALGKAAPAMARGAAAALRGSLLGGIVVCDRAEPLPHPLIGIIGAHPVTDHRSVAAGTAIHRFLSSNPTDRLLVLVSGGGSAMVELPVPGIDIERLADVVSRLEAAGTPIQEINLVRRHLSLIKNGGLSAMSSDDTITTFVLSDIVGGQPQAVASGPTISDGSRADEALAVLVKRLGSEPRDISSAFAMQPPFMPRSGDVALLATTTDVAKAAAAHLHGTGFPVEIMTDSLEGESRNRATDLLSRTGARSFLIAAGETTVSGADTGTGGRNQEAALAAALEIEGSTKVFAALATDGRDGPTDAAGGIVDGGTVGRMLIAGVSATRCLDGHDSYPALDASGDLVRTGPTGNNLGDVWLAYGGE